ncbi:MaoC family dehydratase [Cellulosimicrobium protaetiae]|uniref:MaoC family dehydratase n=1 Tax=Cellulosimicrobium protaetiae TaxID=2587808 RepID=A0A6M5ULC4_9MICO|nr:MaoC family dehydratase [Cellulosimicrobium protaetiae]QJW37619.1 MaoC family dehydratase [Cellulosimicrobium protaetiae]
MSTDATPTPTRPALTDLTVGDVIGTRTVEVDRARLVRYAGASGDFNPIHWNDAFAAEVGLPGVIAHGMFTMGAAVALVEDWAGDPGAVVDYQTRFTRPVPVPNPGVATLEVTGTVGTIDADAGTVRVDLTVTFEGARVLGKTQAVVRL